MKFKPEALKDLTDDTLKDFSKSILDEFAENAKLFGTTIETDSSETDDNVGSDTNIISDKEAEETVLDAVIGKRA